MDITMGITCTHSEMHYYNNAYTNRAGLAGLMSNAGGFIIHVFIGKKYMYSWV